MGPGGGGSYEILIPSLLERCQRETLPSSSLGNSKKCFFIVWVFPIICNYMRHSTTQAYGSKPTIYDASFRVIYSKYTTYDVSHMRFYPTCCSFSHRIGRVAGLYATNSIVNLLSSILLCFQFGKLNKCKKFSL